MKQEFVNHGSEQEVEVDLRQLFFILLKRRHIIISFTVILTTLALIYSFMAKPVYKASSRIFIETNAPKVVKFEDVDLPDYRDATLYINSQIEILKSGVIARLVNEDIGGYKTWGERLGKKRDDISEQQRTEALLKNISIKTLPRTQIIEIGAEDIDPEMAAKIANSWIYAYIAYPQESDSVLSRRATGWLEKSIEKAKVKLDEAERKLSDYRNSHKITSFEGSSEGSGDNVALLNELVKKKAELEVELAQQLNYFKDKHPKIIGLRSEIKSIEGKIEKEMALRDKAVEYTILKREVETSRALYESLMNRMLHSETVEGLKSNVKIVDEAQVPKAPVRPKKRLNVILALFIGLFLGTGAALLFESMDLSIKSPEDIKNVLGLPFLGIVPLASNEEKTTPDSPLKGKISNPALKAFEDHFSNISEAYRSLRTSIIFSNPDAHKKTILITSTGPQEGKSTTATNLSIVMAQAGEKVVLIDADFRRPNLHNIFGISRSGGITEILSENKDNLSSYIHSTEVPNLDLLVCGSIPPNPSELLGSKKMEWLINELSKIYDRIIIDTPPVLAATDAVVLASKVEVTLLVAKANHTHKNAALRAKELLNSVNAKITGMVLNMVQPDKRGGNYYYYYYYHYKYGRKKKEHQGESEV